MRISAAVIQAHLLGQHSTTQHLVRGVLGSGKTRLMADLAQKTTNGVLVLTPTAKSKREWQERLGGGRRTTTNDILVESIETCSTQILHHNHHHMLQSRMVRDRAELWAMFSSRIFQLPLPDRFRPLLDPTSQVSKVLEFFSWLKRSNVAPDQFASAAAAAAGALPNADLAPAYVAWNHVLQTECGVHESEDLIAAAINSLQQSADGLLPPQYDGCTLLVDDAHLLLPNQALFATLLGRRMKESVLFTDVKQTDAYRPSASVSSWLSVDDDNSPSLHVFDELEPQLQPRTFVPLGGRVDELQAIETWIKEQRSSSRVAVICTRSAMDRDVLYKRLARSRDDDGNVKITLLGGRDYWLESVEVRSVLAFVNIALRGHLTADRDVFMVWTSPLFASRYNPTEDELNRFAERSATERGGHDVSVLSAIQTFGGARGKLLAADLAYLDSLVGSGEPLSVVCAEVLRRTGVLERMEEDAAGRIDLLCQLVRRIERRLSASSHRLQPTSLEVLDHLDFYMSAGGGGDAGALDTAAAVVTSEEEEEEDVQEGGDAANGSVLNVYMAAMHTVCNAFPANSVDALCLARATAQKLPLRRRPLGLALPWALLQSTPGPQLDPAYFQSPKDMDERLLAAVCERLRTDSSSATVHYSHEPGEEPSALLLSSSSSSDAASAVGKARKRGSSAAETSLDADISTATTTTPQVNLSFSTLSVYESCPKKYWYSKVLGLVVPSNLRMVNGKALHCGIEAHYKARMEAAEADEQVLLQTAEQEYLAGFARALHGNPEGFVSHEHVAQVKQSGLDTIRAFHSRYVAAGPQQQRKVVQAEQRFEFDWKEAGITVTGIVDLVERDMTTTGTGGGLVLTDFKSNVLDKGKLQRLGRGNNQLAMYAWFCEREWKQTPQLVGIESIETGDRYEEEPGGGAGGGGSSGAFDRVQAKLRHAAQGIRRKDFDATPSYMDCTFCSFNKLCKSSAV